MGVYINKAELLKELSVIQDRPVRSAMQIIKILPTIDLVRCGECKWYNPWHANYTNIDGNYCRKNNRPMKPTDFCSYGERRSE